LGQFTEVKDDCVFTVEYSVRTAQEVVYDSLTVTKSLLLYVVVRITNCYDEGDIGY